MDARGRRKETEEVGGEETCKCCNIERFKTTNQLKMNLRL